MKIEFLEKANRELENTLNNGDSATYLKLKDKYIKENNISSAFWAAYDESCYCGLELIDCEQIIWINEFKEIMENLKKFKVKEFTISANRTDSIEIIKRFVDLGCEIIGVTTIKKPYQSNFITGVFRCCDLKPAIKLKVG